MRLAIAEIQQETGSFLPDRTTLDHFRHELLVYGDDVLRALGDRLEIGGAVAAGQAREDVEWVPLLAGTARAWGPLVHADYLTLKRDLLARLDAAGPVDGMLMVLHGALQTDELGDPEGDLLAALRERLGDRPLVAAYDLHVNVTALKVASVDGMVAYHTSPHMDHFDTGRRAAELLFAAVERRVRPVTAYRKLPMITPAEHHLADRGPFGDIMAEVKRLEARPGVLAVSFCPVQPWLDVPELGWAFVVVTDGDPALAQRLADDLAAQAWPRRHEFLPETVPMRDAVRQAATGSGMWMLVDAGDNTGGGAAGDGNLLLAAILDTAPDLPALITITDPEAARAAARAGQGSHVTLDVGARFNTVHYRPLRITGDVRLIADGIFTLTGPTWHGLTMDVGTTAILDVGPVTVVLTERAVYNLDPCIYRTWGIEPASYRVVQTKSPAGFRTGYEPIAARIVHLESPGFTTSQLATLPFRVAPRPLFPLDDVPDAVALAFRTP